MKHKAIDIKALIKCIITHRIVIMNYIIMIGP